VQTGYGDPARANRMLADEEKLKEGAAKYDPETIDEGTARIRGWLVFCNACQHTHARIGGKKGKCFTCDCGDRH
jgi:hypothetical protein